MVQTTASTSARTGMKNKCRQPSRQPVRKQTVGTANNEAERGAVPHSRGRQRPGRIGKDHVQHPKRRQRDVSQPNDAAAERVVAAEEVVAMEEQSEASS
jgi:hypothetical protein